MLAATGAALVAVGAMTTARARAVIEDYEQARASGEDHQRPRMSEQAARPAASASPGIGLLRVVPSGQVIDQPWGQLTIGYVTLTDRATTVQVTLQPGRAQDHPFRAARSRRRAHADSHRRRRDNGDRGVLWRAAPR